MGKFFPFTTWGSFPYNTVNEGRADIMNKQEVYAFLKEKNLDFEITEHPAVYSMEELAQVALPYPEADAKNLFVRDDKKRNYYLITVKGDKRVDLKKFQKKHGTRRLSFASADDLMAIMGLIPGAVTPLGVLNDAEPGKIGVHPNDNTATVWLKTGDLIALISEHGNTVHSMQIE